MPYQQPYQRPGPYQQPYQPQNPYQQGYQPSQQPSPAPESYQEGR